MRLLTTVFLLLALAGACLSGCQDEPARKVDMTKREPVRYDRPHADLTYAYLPQYAHSESFRRHHQLLELLARKSGLSIRQVFPDTFQEHMDMVGKGLIDISYVNPFSYVNMAERYKTRAFAAPEEMDGGGARFRGQVIVLADNPDINSIEDLRGKRWIAVDPTSAGGYLFPLGLFLEHGLGPKDFSEMAFAPGPGGKQEKVVLAVLAGKYDVGTIREGTLEVLRGRADLSRIRVLAETPWYPGWCFAASSHTDKAAVEKLKAAMLALDPADPEAAAVLSQAGFTRIVPTSDADFGLVRRLLDRVAAHVRP